MNYEAAIFRQVNGEVKAMLGEFDESTIYKATQHALKQLREDATVFAIEVRRK